MFFAQVHLSNWDNQQKHFHIILIIIYGSFQEQRYRWTHFQILYVCKLVSVFSEVQLHFLSIDQIQFCSFDDFQQQTKKLRTQRTQAIAFINKLFRFQQELINLMEFQMPNSWKGWVKLRYRRASSGDECKKQKSNFPFAAQIQLQCRQYAVTTRRYKTCVALPCAIFPFWSKAK